MFTSIHHIIASIRRFDEIQLDARWGYAERTTVAITKAEARRLLHDLLREGQETIRTEESTGRHADGKIHRRLILIGD
jgi:hypothetical protein